VRGRSPGALHDGYRLYVWRCALRLCECIHLARKRRFFHGAALPDPARLLQGTGKFMRHVKRCEAETGNGHKRRSAIISRLIDTAYSDIKARVENG
jgi:hypothetical protein